MTHIPAPPESPTPHPRSAAIQSRRISRVPAFAPVPVRARRDGWTAWRQAAFVGWLAETRCVKAAAGQVGMSRESAYRLRRRKGAAGFCAAWDSIMGDSIKGDAIMGAGDRAPAKVTVDQLYRRVHTGTYRPVMRGGRYVGTVHKADNAALRSALRHIDRVAAARERRGDPLEGHGE